MPRLSKGYFAFFVHLALWFFLFYLIYEVLVALMFLMIGVFLLPLLIIATPFGIYALWKNRLGNIEQSPKKFLALCTAYFLYLILLIPLDRVSWHDDGNLQMYLNFLRDLSR